MTELQSLEWAAEEERITVTHDRGTMPNYAADRMAAGEMVAGLIVVSRRLPIIRVIDELKVIVSCSEAGEWENIIRHLPL